MKNKANTSTAVKNETIKEITKILKKSNGWIVNQIYRFAVNMTK